MSSTLQFNHNAAKVLEVLDTLVERCLDMTEPMAGIAEILAGATERAFADQADPETGEAWPALSERYLAMRPSRQGGQILQASGQLAASVLPDSGKNFAQIGTNKVYAPTHQFGAEQGEFGRTSRGGPIPWGDIPARPYLGINEEDQADMLDILAAYLAE